MLTGTDVKVGFHKQRDSDLEAAYDPSTGAVDVAIRIEFYGSHVRHV